MVGVHRQVRSHHERHRVVVKIHRVQVSFVNEPKLTNITIMKIVVGSSSGRRSSGSRHVSSTTVTSTEAQSQSNNNNASSNNASVPPGSVNNSTSAVNGQSVDANNVPAALPAPPVNPTLKCKFD